ncbi:coiled-coil protein [Legionella sainthelensi]|nr:coiled-coil protein [Legionella sainthelensi]
MMYKKMILALVCLSKTLYGGQEQKLQHQIMQLQKQTQELQTQLNALQKQLVAQEIHDATKKIKRQSANNNFQQMLLKRKIKNSLKTMKWLNIIHLI